jgi:hypothetical protein
VFSQESPKVAQLQPASLAIWTAVLTLGVSVGGMPVNHLACRSHGSHGPINLQTGESLAQTQTALNAVLNHRELKLVGTDTLLEVPV